MFYVTLAGVTDKQGSPPRRRRRLPHPIYSQPGAYFVTLVTHRRATLFGRITDGRTELSRFGLILSNTVRELPKYYPTVELDEHVIMPDHFHAILWIRAVEDGIKSADLMEIIRGLKSISARRINRERCSEGRPVWQRSFHDRVIRSEKMLDEVRRYIRNNPLAG